MNACSECGEPTDRRDFCEFCQPEKGGKKRAEKRKDKENRRKGRDRRKGAIRPTYEDEA
jgi:hypothetical protein